MKPKVNHTKTIMPLEIIIGNLRETCKLFQLDTIQHVDQLMNRRRTNAELCDQWFYTADGEIYFLKGKQNIPTLAITRGSHNPVLIHMDDSFTKFTENYNYRLSQADVEQALAAPETVQIALPDLRLSERASEYFNYLVIRTKPSKYGQLNREERKLAERVYGRGDDFVQNMKMLRDRGIRKTRIQVLNANYVRTYAALSAIARVSWLGNFNYDSNFSASLRDIQNAYPICGVRK